MIHHNALSGADSRWHHPVAKRTGHFVWATRYPTKIFEPHFRCVLGGFLVDGRSG